jgi:ankyrin repeat protein
MLRRSLRIGFATSLTALSLSVAVRAQSDTAPVADAAMRGDRTGIAALLRRGADVNSAQGDGMTALHWAALRGDAVLAEALVKAGASVSAATRIAKYSPLHLAAQIGDAATIEVLLRTGADANAASDNGTTPLMLSAAAGDTKAVGQLLLNGAHINARENPKGHTALMFAAAADRVEVVRALLDAGADSAATTTVFDLSEVEIPADRSAANNAITKTQREAAEAARKQDPTARPLVAGLDRSYEYHELVAAQGGLAALHFAARQGHTKSVRALIEGGADINQVTAGVGASPLMIAIVNGHFDLAGDLIGRGADPNLAAENGVAPLFAVLHCQWSDKAQTPQPRAHLQQQTTYLELLTRLLDMGADPNARLKKKIWYAGYTQDNSGLDEIGATAFWRAAYANDVEAMRLLVAGGADPNIPTAAGRRQPGNATLSALPIGAPGGTPLHAATGLGYLQSYAGNGHRIHPAGWMRGVRYLVEELGADVNARDHEGNTPAHYAAARGDNEMLLYLVSRGADVSAVNRRGQTTVDAANGPRQRVQPFPETITLLESLGAVNNHKCVTC